jgi:hypothetical protein
MSDTYLFDTIGLAVDFVSNEFYDAFTNLLLVSITYIGETFNDLISNIEDFSRFVSDEFNNLQAALAEDSASDKVNESHTNFILVFIERFRETLNNFIIAIEEVTLFVYDEIKNGNIGQALDCFLREFQESFTHVFSLFAEHSREILNNLIINIEKVSLFVSDVITYVDMNKKLVSQALSVILLILLVSHFLIIWFKKVFRSRHINVQRENHVEKLTQQPSPLSDSNDENDIENEHERLQRRVRRLENERHGYTCCICQTNLRTILLMPCKHLCICDSCFGHAKAVYTNTLSKCPICRTNIVNYIRVYS